MARRDPVDDSFIVAVRALGGPTVRRVPAHTGLTNAAAVELFDAQAASRHLDFAARHLRAEGDGFYTIGSAGHESNAAVAMALRSTDPALLHYRSGGFYVARARQVAGHDPVRDVLLGLVGSAEEPIAGGRHKVFGHPDLAIIPQTSTIGSHLPRAVGTAFAIERARGLGLPTPWPADSIVVCSFGDASANHSTVTGAINAACWSAYQGVPVPLLLVCEDNGIGISVPTPPGWIAHTYDNRRDLRYLHATGSDPAATVDTATTAAAWVREHRRPALLHLSTVRLMGHAGSDVETAYRTPAEIAADLDHDPLLATARLLVESGTHTPAEVLDRYEAIREHVRQEAEKARERPRLATAAQVVAPLAPHRPDAVVAATGPATTEERARVFGGVLPEDEGPLTLAQSINRALLDAAARHPGLLVFGEDVARKGGVYGVTRGLRRRLGARRVFDTPLDEQTILGLALGAGLAGLLPVPEIQYLAYLHNAADQLRGEAATLSFFSQGHYRNPLVVRIAGYAYQKGFGGHFHNDNAVGALRDIPGLVIASPARPDDAPDMLRTCLAAAETDGRVCVFLEPIALYHTRDLHEPGDEGWVAPYRFEHVPLGRARTHGDGPDLTIVTFGNGLRMSLRAARRLRAAGVHARVVDLRWLAPLPADDLRREAEATGRVLVVDETRRTGGVAEGVVTALVDDGFAGPIARVASEDSFVPLGDAANLVLVGEDRIEEAALRLAGR
ncbi:MAG TPA: thiamine pyrophosphate-dependent enzyme [Actinophytocola sp.]|jgi:2-oxoisovalerate dehydrogenase E1 component|nr:thiamine pyrophosphate-dependent enzyme [Actinophytocola sp.]